MANKKKMDDYNWPNLYRQADKFMRQYIPETMIHRVVINLYRICLMDQTVHRIFCCNNYCKSVSRLYDISCRIEIYAVIMIFAFFKLDTVLCCLRRITCFRITQIIVTPPYPNKLIIRLLLLPEGHCEE